MKRDLRKRRTRTKPEDRRLDSLGQDAEMDEESKRTTKYLSNFNDILQGKKNKKGKKSGSTSSASHETVSTSGRPTLLINYNYSSILLSRKPKDKNQF